MRYTEAKTLWRSRLRDESGQVIVLTVLMMAVLLGFVAFAVDVGMLLYAKRQLQTAADSGAIAGSAEYNYGDIQSAVDADTAQNGYTNGSSGTTVTVNPPPLSGWHSGNYGAVEVIVAHAQPTLFMNAFELVSFHSSAFSTLTVSARAVAELVPSTKCIYSMGTAAPDIVLNSGATVSAPGCDVLDGGQGFAMNVAGGASLAAKSVGLVGYGEGDITPNPIPGMNPVEDPLSFLTPPAYNPASCTAGPVLTGAQSQTIGPPTAGGTVCFSSLSIAGTGTVTFSPGTYVITGGMQFNSTGTITGDGVTFYFVGGGQFSDSGGESLSLTAPTSGPYQGILFYQDPSDIAPFAWSGGGTVSLNGILYAPNAIVTLSNGGPTPLNLSMVVGSLFFNGNTSLQPFVPAQGNTPLSSPVLVE